MLNQQNRICFIGNCQALNLKKIADEAGLEVQYFLSMFVNPNHMGRIEEAKEYLKHYLSAEQITELISTGSIKINPSTKDFHKFNPDTFVYTLFHESRSCYRHKKSGFIIEVNEEYWPENVGAYLWNKLQTDFDQIIPDNLSYLTRFKTLIHSFIESFPDAQHIIIERIKIFSTSDKSTLKNWDRIQTGADKFYSDINNLKTVKVVKISQAIEDYTSKCGLENSFPVLFEYNLEKDRYKFTKHYDIEHPGKYYWQLVFKELYPNYSPKFSRSKNIEIETNNSLANAITAGDKNLFAEILKKNKDIEIPVETLQAGAFIFGSDFFNHIKEYLEHRMNYSQIFYRTKAARLIRICSDQKIIQSISENAKIALWGAGGRCRSSIEVLKNKFNIQYILDSDPTKHGQKILEIPIIFYENLPENIEIEAIIITTVFFNQVTATILKNSKLNKLKILNSNELLDKAIFLKNTSTLDCLESQLLHNNKIGL